MVVLIKPPSAAVAPHDYASVYNQPIDHRQRKLPSSSTSTRPGTRRARPSAWERVPPAASTSTSQPSWEASRRPRSPPPGIMTSQHQEQKERRKQRQHHRHLHRQSREDEEEEEKLRRSFPPPSSLSPPAPSLQCPPLITTSPPPRLRRPSPPPPPVTTTLKAPFSSSFFCSSSSSGHYLAPPPSPPSSSLLRSPRLSNPTAAFEHLSRLRARIEGAFQKLLTDLPVLKRHLNPPHALAPLTPAFDLVALKRQVGALQDELASRYTHQEGMRRENVKLWELLQTVCDTPFWAAVEEEINFVHAALRERQAEVETLQHTLKESQSVKARLLAVRGEREKVHVNLKAAQEGTAEVSRALAAVMADNQGLEEELEQQTAAMQDLQRYLAKCQATQQEEHLEELGEMAARFASSSSVLALRRRRDAFALLRLAAHRSRRLRELGVRFEAAGAKALAHKALASLAEHRRVAQHRRRVQDRQDAVLLRSFWRFWHRHTKQEQFFQLAVRRRLLRWCLNGWRKVAAEGQRDKRLEAQTQKLQDKRMLQHLFQGWHRLTSHATASRREGTGKAAAAWKRRAWKVFGRRLEQQRAAFQAKGVTLTAQRHRRRLREGWRVWVLQMKVARFEGWMLERHPQRAPTTLARCLVTWAAWVRHRRVLKRAAVTEGKRQLEVRKVARAVQSLARNARLERRARAAERKGNKARITRAMRQALLLQWLPCVEAWRLRRVDVEKGILTRRRHALRRGLLLWAGWTRRERKTRSWARPYRPGSRLHGLSVAMGQWKALVARRVREKEGRREGRLVARRWEQRHKAQAFRRWRDAILGRGHSGSGCEVEGIRTRGQEGLQARALMQQAFNVWVPGMGSAMTRGGGREWRSGEGVASSRSAILLREIDALVAQVDEAERHLEAKVLAVTTAVTAVGAAAEQPRVEENEQGEDVASTIAYLQQQLSAFKSQEGMLPAQQRAAEGWLCAPQECLGHLEPSASYSSSFPSSSSSGEKADSFKEKTMNKKEKGREKSSDTASTGDKLLAARQSKALCHIQAQEEATLLAVARREMAGRVRGVKEPMQELIATAHKEVGARTMRSRRKRVEKAALKTRLAQLLHAAGSKGGDGDRKGGGSRGEQRERREDEKQDLDLSQMLGLDDDEDGDEDIRARKNAEKGRFTGRGNASTEGTSASSPIKKRSKTLFVPSPTRGLQPLRPSSRPIRCRSSVTAVGGLVFAGDGRGEERWEPEGGEEKGNDDDMLDYLTDSIDALQARILDKLNNIM